MEDESFHNSQFQQDSCASKITMIINNMICLHYIFDFITELLVVSIKFQSIVSVLNAYFFTHAWRIGHNYGKLRALPLTRLEQPLL